MLKLLPAVVASLLIFSHADAPAQSSKSPPKRSEGKIRGLILDPNDARISYAIVTIRSSPKLGFRKELKVDDAGAFEVRLPPGVYYLSVEAKTFCNFEGWELKVRPGVTEMINIHMEGAASHGPCHCTLKKP